MSHKKDLFYRDKVIPCSVFNLKALTSKAVILHDRPEVKEVICWICLF